VRRLSGIHTVEAGDAGVLADADQGDPLGGHAEAGQPVQDLDDLQLVVEVGLEPGFRSSSRAKAYERVA
jgi:hypothetical protein